MAEAESAVSALREEVAALRQRVRELEAETERLEELRQRLREEDSFRSGVIDRAAEGLCVCHAVEEFPYVEFSIWNPRMVAITGYTMEQINRLGWYQSLYADPEVRERAIQRMAAMREGDDLLYERWEITRLDGEKRVVGISTTLLTTHDGRSHALALIQDITSEERYREMLEERVATLEGLLPICSSCKKIRDAAGEWQGLERYIDAHTELVVTHGICPECMHTLYPDYADGP